MLNGANPNPFRPRYGRMLHEEEGSASSVGITLHDHGAIEQVRQKHRRQVRVVLQQAAFGDAELGPEGLTQVCQANESAVDFQFDLIAIRGHEHGTAARLSPRVPFDGRTAFEKRGMNCSIGCAMLARYAILLGHKNPQYLPGQMTRLRDL